MTQGNNGRRLARALGWFSVGLGASQLLAPRTVNRFVGVHGTTFANAVMRAVGVQELTVPTSQHVLSRAKTVITVNLPAQDVYGSWRDAEQLPWFMYHLQSLQPAGQGRWRWVAHGSAGKTVEWSAEIVEDRPGEFVAWRSVGESDIGSSGSVRFSPAPGDRGTEVKVEVAYTPPRGRAGTVIAKLLGEEPEQQIRDDMRRFKQVMEAGEVVRSDGNPEGTATHRQLKQRPAQPVA